MSISSSISMAANTLRANEIALQVIGQNIANANTPGYLREEVVLSPGPTQRLGRLLLGTGVTVDAVVQKIDYFLEERLRGAVSDRSNAETQQDAYLQLEGVIGELSDTDLSTSLSNFFGAIDEVLNTPGDESGSARNLAVLQGATLAGDITRLSQRVSVMREDVNDRIITMGDTINRLTEQIRVLNVRIANTEGGDVSQSDAVGLRDQRGQALEELAQLTDIRVTEQKSGGVAVYTGSDFLVFEGVRREVEVEIDSDEGMPSATINVKDTDSPLGVVSGELAGLIAARDEIMGGFLANLDDFARTLAFEFNKVYSRGQGLNGYVQLTSEFAVVDKQAALDAAGLQFTPVNGSFQVMVHNQQTDQTLTTDVMVDLNGIGDDMTMEDLVAALDAIDGIAASVSSGGKLTLSSESADQEFAFAGDTSGLLAALGVNTFFSGSSARDLGVNDVVRADPATFAASVGGIGVDTENAVALAAFPDQRIASKNGASLLVLYDQFTGEATQAAAVGRAVTEGATVFENTLRGQKMAISGVSIDEEAVQMIAFQRSFQASARYIATLSEMFEMLVNL